MQHCRDLDNALKFGPHNTCKGLVKNPKVNVDWIARKYKNKVTSDLRIVIGILIKDFKIMYRVGQIPRKVYRVKRKILEPTVDGDHIESSR